MKTVGEKIRVKNRKTQKREGGNKEKETRWRTWGQDMYRIRKTRKTNKMWKLICYLPLTSNCPESTNVSTGLPFRDMEQGSRKLYQLSSGDKEVRMPLEGERNWVDVAKAVEATCVISGGMFSSFWFSVSREWKLRWHPQAEQVLDKLLSVSNSWHPSSVKPPDATEWFRLYTKSGHKLSHWASKRNCKQEENSTLSLGSP